MTESAAVHPVDPFDPQAINATEGLEPVDPAFAKVLRVTALFNMVPLAIGASVFDRLLIPTIGGPCGVVTTLAWIAAATAVLAFPSRRAQRWGFKIGEGQLRVARGWLFRTDTIVPFVRVQHIDVGQGPVERWFGLSHLIVHTSGTHNSTVTLPGLPADLAAAMRETIRRHIQTDFA
ncbi:MAG: PH domain-containing protein [Sphingopyxis sp.]|uniref:PH domain-containing protein n=1 Tax=Sphingopyxis sp. TaxID=1908224 RepID=UPI002AB94B7C|nr:PH domain-containing protein [Sphingopyxis sp.]MDZ3833279.1 PH domain-containing protein [Sphingopyxis sp.]